jgi:cytochrome P450 family 89 subfamily A
MAAFKVGDASEYLAITGWGIDAVKLGEKTWVWVWLLSAALLALYLFVLLRRRAKQGRRLPAGPPSVPLFGNLLWRRNSAADVEPLLLRLFERYGPVVTLRIGSRLNIFVTDRHLAHAALVGPASVTLSDRLRAAASARLGSTDNRITRADYGPTWRLLRCNLVSETLQPSRVRLFALARTWVRRVLLDKLRESSASSEPNVMEAFQYSMFCLLVLMCFGERLDETAGRAIEDAERAWLIYISRQLAVFFVPSPTRHVFRGRLETARALQRRQRDLFVPLINKRHEYKRRVKEDGGHVPVSETTFQHSYVDTLLRHPMPPLRHPTLSGPIGSEPPQQTPHRRCSSARFFLARLG